MVSIKDDLATALRYQPLESVIGKEVFIRSFSTLEEELKSQLLDEIPFLGELEQDEVLLRHFGGPSYYFTFAKYRLLDLTFICSPSIECMSAGMQVLQLFDFSESEEEYLRQTLTELKADGSKRYVRLLVQSNDKIPQRSIFRDDIGMMTKRQEDDFTEKLIQLAAAKQISVDDISYFERTSCFASLCLPQMMTIADACLTNYRSVWSEKHFYA